MDWVMVKEPGVASWSSNSQGSHTSSRSSEIAEDAQDVHSSSWSVPLSERSEGLFMYATEVRDTPCCHIDTERLFSPGPQLDACTPSTPRSTSRFLEPAETMTPPEPSQAVIQHANPWCRTPQGYRGSVKGCGGVEKVSLQQHNATSCKMDDQSARLADLRRQMEAEAQRRQIESDIDEIATLCGACVSTSGNPMVDVSPFCSYNAVPCPLTCRHFADMQEDGFPDYPLPGRDLHAVPTQFRMCVRRRRQQPAREWGSTGSTGAFMV